MIGQLFALYKVGKMGAIRILLLEDDRLFNETLQDFLEEEGMQVDTALDPYTALDLAYEKIYDLYLFDVNLPYESGFDLLGRLRESGDMTPTIFITSREDKASLKEGFGSGGDDYLKKPVDLEELRLRIDALLRRQVRHTMLPLGRYRFDTQNRRLYLDGEEIVLGKKSAMLLLVLLEAQGNIVSLEAIKTRLWSTSEPASDGALRVYVAQLKRYFPHAIENERGVGYRLDTGLVE
jgi:two-component system response regulator QseB